MKVLIAIQSFYEGGAEMAAIRLANELKNRNVKVFFFELEYGFTREKKFKKYLDNSIPVYQPDLNWWLRKLSIVRHYSPKFMSGYYTCIYVNIKKYLTVKFIRKSSIRIVNSHSFKTDEFFSKISKSRFKLISSFHGHYELFQKEFPIQKTSILFNKVLYNIDYVVYTTERHLNTLRKYNFPLTKTSKIYYGFSSKFISNINSCKKNEPLRLCVVSRAIPGKGWEEIIQAVINVAAKRSGSIELDLLGEGKLLPTLKENYGHFPFIQFVGYKDSEAISNYLDNAHLGVLLSNYEAESMPNSIIEYLAHGKPVLSTNNGSIKDMVTYNGSLAGTILDLEDGNINIMEVENAIINYLNQLDLLNDHAKKAKKAFKKFDINNYAKAYLNLYRNLYSEDPRTSLDR